MRHIASFLFIFILSCSSIIVIDGHEYYTKKAKNPRDGNYMYHKDDCKFCKKMKEDAIKFYKTKYKTPEELLKKSKEKYDGERER